ncbi:5-formyltetrahydrofolate cyclo-ligase [Mycobacterium sp.]|uniref:5-formyltetrahydrofolate cyclo-ligase n=1 Tax=Mycobacterium sp. TaxID=1785 RepID=UPI0012879458|nr:5-formyltetrahydrofolate cyclo-ligase [Mycobacterium sp.]KAA8968842.1 MAG: 5-formyltetrahydrofolate cyclo-ligase [Mycobacterium sp.]
MAGKAALRQQLLAARRAVAADLRAAEADQLADHVAGLVGTGDTVCAYVPVGTEPGSVEMLDVLRSTARRVLLPVALTSADGTPCALRWGEYRPGRLVRGRSGLLEPAKPWLPPEALAEASLALVPALAVDRRGVRLGRGRGFYDRALVDRNPHARLVAVVRDCELVDELPHEPHDVRMTHALTPGHGLIKLDDTVRESHGTNSGSST